MTALGRVVFESMRWTVELEDRDWETDGQKLWTYAQLPFENEERLKRIFGDSNSQFYALHGYSDPAGMICKNKIIPVAPSYVLNQQVRLIHALTSKTFMWVSKITDLGIHFNVEEQQDIQEPADNYENYDSETLDDYFLSPDEDDQIFEDSVRRFKEYEARRVTKESKIGIEVQDELNHDEHLKQSTEITLDNIFPPSIVFIRA